MRNKGFTLIELVVSMAILSVIGIGIAGFVYVSLQQYLLSHSEVDIQYEAQVTQNKIQDMIMDVTDGISVSSSGNTILYLYDYDGQTDRKLRTQLMFQPAEAKLYYQKWYLDESDTSEGPAGTWHREPGSSEEILSEFVEEFKVTLYGEAKGAGGDIKHEEITGQNTGSRIKKVDIHLKYRIRQRQCELDCTVAPRNRVIESRDAALLYQ